MELWKSLGGILTAEFTSPEPKKTMDSITKSGIPISHIVQVNELVYQFQISRAHYKNLLQVLKRNGADLRVVRKRGLFWKLAALQRHPVLLIVCCFILVSSPYIPSL